MELPLAIGAVGATLGATGTNDHLLTLNVKRWSAGHIGAHQRELLGNAESCRDLSHRSHGAPNASTEIRDALAQDPAYRPNIKSV